jgi:uncharacterized membrane protein
VGDNDSQALRWRTPFSAAPEVLGTVPNSGGGAAVATNRTGTVVVGWDQVGTNHQAVIWTPAAQSINTILSAAGANPASLPPSEAKAVSTDGKIVVGDGLVNGLAVLPWVVRLP